jgi:UDP-N-acetylglucosamine/UDP-N-acetylgalactosamine diphosphorylase
MVDEAELKSRYEKAGQGHVLRHLSELSPSEKEALLQELNAIKVEQLGNLLESALAEQHSLDEKITPFSKDVGRTSDKEEMEVAYNIGIEAIHRGEVAALVLAGGQGTRLGFSGPKGMYDIGLPSGRTLFHLISERLRRLRERGGKSEEEMPSLPFYIMTSPINHEVTTDYFEKNLFFGLPKADVCFFEQGMLPCLTSEGKIIMETASKVSMAPDGNGGIYPSLHNSGMLADMAKRGIKYLHVFSIDNALTKPADPVFIGYCISKEADCGNKVVWKASAHEKVGVIAEKAGKSCVVEYSDITKEMAERTDENGRLCFGAGNICNHFYTLDFLQNSVLPNLGNMYHVAEKKIPFYDEESKQTIKPEANNGIKLESFIFDVFPLSERMAVLDALREEEFAPVKNAPGSQSDSPDTARAYLSEMAKKWVAKSGGFLKGDIESICEVGPLSSYGGEGLESFNGKEIECPFSL